MDCDFRLGEWLVSPALNQIASNGNSARVEPKAMRVLVYLAQHPGVVSKDQLIAAVWPDVFVSDDVLPGCISALRKVFSDDARRPRVIETIHKGGYRLLLPVETLNGNGTPHAKTELPRSDQPKLSTRLILAVGVIALAVLLVAAFAWASYRHRYDSIAVLPFVDTSADSTTQYLSDGIAEQVTNDLSQLRSLRVMAWTTVARYRGPKLDARAAGRDLGVNAVLTGHLVREGDHIALQAELVDVNRGTQLWGKQYDRQTSEVSRLQQDLSNDIVSNLRVRLSGKEQEKIQQRQNTLPAAYELYLQGRFYWGKRTKEGLAHGIDLFQQAIALDPNYALAYAGLADCYNLLDDWGDTAPRDSFPKARAAAERAIALDDSLAEAHVSLAMVHEAYDWDWVAAEREFKRAIELNPNYATAHQWYGLFLASMGRFSEAEVEVRKAQQLDPLSPIVKMALAEVYTWQRRYDDALSEYKKVIALDPSFLGSYGNLAYVYEQKHMLTEAVNNLSQHWTLRGEPDFARDLQRAYANSGYRGVIRQELKRALDERARGEYNSPTGIASLYAALGEQAHVLEWLQKGYEEHSSGMDYLAIDPEFDSVRSNPKYQYWLGVLGLPSSVNIPRS
ncbi:MAG TPA: winged helix-turn-helix domain-containing protein [Terriglobales bacterium]|nr:winged helix-turn-helix domain-containing protein [Terriglobales bacterium]